VRKNWVRSTLSQAVDQCRDEVYGLAEEMRDVFDRTPQVFQETTGKPREEAADWLEVASD
jgi:hypothetical protein